MPSTRRKLRQPRGKRRQYRVFISHSSSDRWIAQVIAEKIEALGATCWFDEKDLKGGDIVLAEIIRGIDACDEALVLISPASVHSPWVSFEIGGVRAQHKRITPILNNVTPDEMAPMKDIKGLELNRIDRFLVHLKSRIERIKKD